MKTRGFTLIELLAVIVILAIIALISVPVIVGVIEKARLGSAESSALGYIDAVEKQIAINLLDKELDDIIEGTYTIEEMDNYGVKVKGEKPSSGEVVVTSKVEEATLCMGSYRVDYKNNKVIATKDSDCSTIKEEPKILYKESILNGSDPVLDEGMIPITIESDGTVKKADVEEKWYEYSTKSYANAVLVSSDVRGTYKDGDVIPENKILAYFVWIPRYEYETITSTSAGRIKINFISKETITATSNYIIHPAFTFDGKELSGLWIGKFETTGSASNPTIKPNIASLRTQNISTQFKTALVFGNRTLNSDGTVTDNSDKTTYGLKSESRMMKNIEWGVVAYLTYSNYGSCTSGSCVELSINNSSSYLTGSSNGSPTSSSGTTYNYATTQSLLASTNKNITGIFDISGGAREYVMGAQYNSAANTSLSIASTGFTQTQLDGLNAKYITKYAYGTTYNDANAYNRGIDGDATKEVKKWNSDWAGFINNNSPWFERGGLYSAGTSAGSFAFYLSNGKENDQFSFRTVVTVY